LRAGIARRRNPLIFLLDHADALAVTLQNGASLVGRAVIHHNQLEVMKALTEHALDRIGEAAGAEL